MNILFWGGMIGWSCECFFPMNIEGDQEDAATLPRTTVAFSVWTMVVGTFWGQAYF